MHKYCPNYSKAVRTTDDDGNVLIARTRCKQWSCGYCANVNRNIWIARIINQVVKGGHDMWFFWTVTLKPSDHLKGDYKNALSHSMKVWRANWDKLMKQAKRDLGKLVYVRIFETHKNGTLHVHMLADKTYSDVVEVNEIRPDGTPNTRHVSATFTGITKRYSLGVIHDIKPIVTKEKGDNGVARNVSSYVTKYMTKELQSDVRSLLKSTGNGRVRMVQTSQNFAKVSSNGIYDWSIGDVSVGEAKLIWYERRDILDVQNGKTLEYDDFEHYPHYPNKASDMSDIAGMDNA